MIEHPELTVAVWMVTFNHERYISQAIESILSQKTNFNFRLFIGEDYSTDSTRAICQQYANRFPGKISLILQTQNTGGYQNAMSVYSACFESGAKYIAMCEGDDYWTDPLKLQKQVDILEADSSIAMVYSNAATITDDKLGEFYKGDQRPTDVFNLHTYLHQYQGLGVSTCTSLLRADAMKAATDFLVRHVNKIISADFAMWAIAGSFGNYHFLEEKTAVYRKHSTGIMGTLGGSRTWLQKGLDLNHFLADYFDGQHDDFFRGSDWWYYSQFSFLDIQEKKYGASLRNIVKSISKALSTNSGKPLSILRDYLYRLRTSNS